MQVDPDLTVGEGLEADHDVVIGYPASRSVRPGGALGESARLRRGTIIYLGSKIGDRFTTGHHVVIREENLIGHDVAVWSNTVVDYGCQIGDRVKIHCNCYISQFSEIREDAFLAPGVILGNDLFPGSTASAEAMTGPLIDAGAQIGINATILPYVTIGEGSLIGAGAVVTKDIPAGAVAYGCPAVVVGRREDLGDILSRLHERRLQRQGGATKEGV